MNLSKSAKRMVILAVLIGMAALIIYYGYILPTKASLPKPN